MLNKNTITALFTTAALVALPMAASANALRAPSGMKDLATASADAPKAKRAKKGKMARTEKAKPRTQGEFDALMAKHKERELMKHEKRNRRIAKIERHLGDKPGGGERIARLTTLETRRHDLRMHHIAQKRFGEKLDKATKRAIKAERKDLRTAWKTEMKEARAEAGLPPKAKKAKGKKMDTGRGKAKHAEMDLEERRGKGKAKADAKRKDKANGKAKRKGAKGKKAHRR